MNIRQQTVDTPCGIVHLAAFPKGERPHREVIFEILSRYSGEKVTASDLVLVEGVSSSVTSRPTFPKLDFDVNWTHSRNECVVAYGVGGSLRGGRGLHVGVDLEFVGRSRLHLAQRFFSPEENAWLAASEQKDSEFYRLWCRKEAFFKCVGGSFFEEVLGRNLLEDCIYIQKSLTERKQVYFVDLPWADSARLCVAVSREEL